MACAGRGRRRCAGSAAAVALVIGSPAAGQPAPLASYDVPVSIDSGLVANNQPGGPAGGRPAVVFSTVASVKGVPWQRLHFGKVELSGSLRDGTASFLRLTSLEDGGVQVLNWSTLAQWGNSSAYFNGEAVLLELLAYPGTGPSLVRVEQITAGIRGQGGVATQCGPTDDRLPTGDVRQGRIIPIGCTGFLINDMEHCFITAGHCPADDGVFVPGRMDCVEFNVPLSDADGTINFADPDDQYPVDDASTQFSDAGIGNDWCYFGTFANANTGLTPFEAQGLGYTLAAAVPATDNGTIRIRGYGLDFDDPELSQTQQFDVGTYDDLDVASIRYDDLDTEGGNSGSAVVKDSSGLVIGIHTNGGCEDERAANHATRIDNAGLQAALANPQGVCAGPCGLGAGSCFLPHGTPGCDNVACCVAVCEVDPFCCDTAWDLICKNEANSICGNCGNPAAGSCYEPHINPGCDDAECCRLVCEVDPYCCEVTWDGQCKDEANQLCGNCGDPDAGNCFEAHPTPGCNNMSCCRVVCEADPFCCDVQWDSICADEAQDLCGDPACPAAGNCFLPHGTPGCSDGVCCKKVCLIDPFCCDIEWDGICANEAAVTCANCGDPGAGNCFQSNPTPGCDDLDCCKTVCLIDPFCCDTQWDSLCANEAAINCGNCGDAGAGNCFVPHPTPGCDDLDCCKTVCVIDPFCCETGWDDLCANEAAVNCGGCGNPTAGNCFQDNGTPGCNDLDCCKAVCLIDPFCCENTWDNVCAGEAQDLCGNDACPAEGNCFQAHGTPGCDNAACCKKVCLIDPFCCDIQWDGICAGEAQDLCGNDSCPAEGSCFQAHGTPGCDDAVCCKKICLIDPFCCDIQWDGICAGEAFDLCENTCPWDCGDFNGDVGIVDFLAMLGGWGGPGPCDFDGGGVVDITDFLNLLAHWGLCP